MKKLTNNYSDCRLINLEPQTPHGPFAVVQNAYDPEDPTMRMTLFILKRDGIWIDELAHFATTSDDKFDIVFDEAANVMQALASLTGTPKIERRDVSTPELQAYLSRLKTTTMESRVSGFLTRYRQSRIR